MKSCKNKIRIYFLGSGEIAVPILCAIENSNFFELVGIGTQADQPSGRKKKLQATAVGLWAENNDIAVDKPDSVNKSSFLSKLEDLALDFILVASFGQLLKGRILSLPEFGCINVHASLLPKYRGASPITMPILNGDASAGVTIMEMEKGLDTGPVFASYKLTLNGKENAQKLELALGELAAQNIDDILLKIYSEELTPTPQNNSEFTYAGKIKKCDGEVHWGFPSVKIERMTRAYYPWPGAYFYLNVGNNKQKKIQITEAIVCRNEHEVEQGRIVKADKKCWIIACGTDALEIKKLIPEGKKEMTGVEFLRGCQLVEGEYA